MKKLLVAIVTIPALLISSLLNAATFNKTQFTFYLKNNTNYPLTLGISHYNETPFTLEKSVILPKTTGSIAVGTGTFVKGAHWVANVSIYAQIGDQKTVDTVTVMNYQLDKYGDYKVGDSGDLTYKGKVYPVNYNNKISKPDVEFTIG